MLTALVHSSSNAYFGLSKADKEHYSSMFWTAFPCMMFNWKNNRKEGEIFARPLSLIYSWKLATNNMKFPRIMQVQTQLPGKIGFISWFMWVPSDLTSVFWFDLVLLCPVIKSYHNYNQLRKFLFTVMCGLSCFCSTCSLQKVLELDFQTPTASTKVH